MQSTASRPANAAAWSISPRTKLKVGPAPYTSPGEGEIVVRSRAVAINPVDWALASLPFISKQVAPWMKYPAVLGEDVAGEVAEVGPGVTRFKRGDRVLAFAAGGNQNRNRAAEGAFQTYVVTLAHMTSPIPDSMSFEEGAVLPLGLSTAACGLFQKDFLALQHPSADPDRTNATLLIWGGAATSVGCNAIQLAVSAATRCSQPPRGTMPTICSPSAPLRCFDYRHDGVVKEIINALKGKSIAGAFHRHGLHGSLPGDCAALQGGQIRGCRRWADLPCRCGIGRDVAGVAASAKDPAHRAFGWVQGPRGAHRRHFIWGGSLVDNEVGRRCSRTSCRARWMKAVSSPLRRRWWWARAWKRSR